MILLLHYYTAPLRPQIIQITCEATRCVVRVDIIGGIYDLLVVTATPLASGQGTGTTAVRVEYPRDGCPYIIVNGLNPNTNYLFEVVAQSGRMATSAPDSQQQSTGEILCVTPHPCP